MPKKIKDVEDTDLETLVLDQEKIEEPKRYNIILHNDDFTTQEFVVHILQSFFYKSEEEAFRLMLKVHLEGKAKVGSFLRDIAESKVALITQYSRRHSMPLLLTIEEE